MRYVVLLFLGLAVLNPLLTKKHYKLYLFLTVCACSALAFFVVPTPNMDLHRYINVMDLYREVGFRWVLQNDMHSNPLASLFFLAVSQLEDDRFLPMIAVFLSYGFSLALLYKAGKRFGARRAELNLALLFFMLNFNFYYVIDVVRIYICFAIMAYFLYVDIVEKKRRWLCWLVYIALCYVHYAMLVFVLVRLYFACTRKLRGGLAVASACVLPVILVVGYKIVLRFGGASFDILGTVSNKAQGYLDYQVFGIWQFIASVLRLTVCACICLLTLWICLEMRKRFGASKMISKVYNSDTLLQIGSARDISIFCLYLILTAATFITNYQFILRTPYFVQILMSAGLLFMLVQLRNLNRNYKLLTFVLIGAESLAHFCYLLVYVYNGLSFQFS